MTKVQTGDIKTGFVDGMGFGFGWAVVREPKGVTAMLSAGTYGHGGAFGTQGWIDPTQDLFVVLLIRAASSTCPTATPHPCARKVAGTCRGSSEEVKAEEIGRKKAQKKRRVFIRRLTDRHRFLRQKIEEREQAEDSRAAFRPVLFGSLSSV